MDGWRENFSGRNKRNSFPPHQKWGVPQRNEFVSESDGWGARPRTWNLRVQSATSYQFDYSPIKSLNKLNFQVFSDGNKTGEYS